MAKINTGLGERNSQKQQSPETEINKALRLVKQVLLLAAGRTLCVCVCVSVCACVHVRARQASVGHISAVRENAGREHSNFCLKYIHFTTAEAEPMSPLSPCAPSQNNLSRVSICLSLLV